MPRKSKQEKLKSTDEQLDELVRLAESRNLTEGFLDGEIEDAADEEAQMAADEVKGYGLADQLRYLLDHNYKADRLKELIEEAEIEGGDDAEAG